MAKAGASTSSKGRPDALASRLAALAALDEDYWSFESKRERDYTHDLFQYPAMMVPRMQREILFELLATASSNVVLYDPFVGSGTMMTEAMLRGCDFVGVDINPLAILLCRAKSECFDADHLSDRMGLISRRALRDTSRLEGPSFDGKRKWFNWLARVELARLQRSIEKERDGAVRRFAWVALAEAIRLGSNSRTSTVKLHIRPDKELDARRGLSPQTLFSAIADRNVSSIREQQQLLAERHLLEGSQFAGVVRLSVGDVSADMPIAPGTASILMTSPPYGDNQTTVTYGQHAYLPLQWIEPEDIERGLSRDCLASTHEIDHRSLGGSTRRALERAAPLRERSTTLNEIISELERHPTVSSRTALDGAKRVSAFYADFDAVLDSVVPSVHEGGYLVWTVGERRVNGRPVPMAEIVTELIGQRALLLTVLERRIPPRQKRMASRNSVAATMDQEQVLVFVKAGPADGTTPGRTAS